MSSRSKGKKSQVDENRGKQSQQTPTSSKTHSTSTTPLPNCNESLVSRADSKDLNILFQSKSNAEDIIVCGMNKILMNLSDMKSLFVKAGNYIKISSLKTFSDSNDTGHFSSLPVSMLCRVFPSKQLTQGVAVMNKGWTSNFDKLQSKRDVRNRMASISTKMTNVRIMECTTCEFCIEGIEDNVASSSTFQAYLIETLLEVALSMTLEPSVSWCGKPYTLKVMKLHQEGSQQNIQPTAEIDVYYIVSRTTLFRPAARDINSTADIGTALDSDDFIIDSTLSERDQIEAKINYISNRFGGYSEQVKEAVIVMQMALEVNHHIVTSTPAHMHAPQRRVFAPLKAPRGILLFGAAGTGKSKLCHLLTKVSGCRSLAISCTILMHKYVGEAEAELARIFAKARKDLPCCVVIDDIDLIFRDRSQANEQQKRLVSCLLSQLDGLVVDDVNNNASSSSRGLFVIAASSRPQNIDAAIRRPGRLDKEIELGVPTSSERESILKALLVERGLLVEDNSDNDRSKACFSEACVRDVAKLAHGMVGSDLMQVIKEAFLIALNKREIMREDLLRDGDNIADICSAVAALDLGKDECMNSFNDNSSRRAVNRAVIASDIDLISAVNKVSPSALREVVLEIPNVRWSDIGGMNAVKQSLKEVVEWPVLFPHLFEKLNISPPRGVLLYGPPGCSKTLMAKALATESSMNFLAVRGPELLSKWLGESEKAIQTLFRRARAAAPCIIFFDEIDALASQRGDSNSGVNDRVLSQLLTEIDGVQISKRVVIIAATNRPDMLDKALLRPGRIDRKIYVNPPDEISRRQIIDIELRKVPLADDIDLNAIVELSDGFSGAEVASICSEATFLAMEQEDMILRQQYLLEAVRGISPQITGSMLEYYDRMISNFKV